MKSFLIAIVIFIAIGVVTAGRFCRRETTEFFEQNSVCAERAVEIQLFVREIEQGAMTYDELASKISSKCKTATSASCYDAISIPITGSCNDDETVQHFRNAFQTVLTFNKYMCENNGQNYLEFVKNDGAACYYNQVKTKCYTDAISAGHIQGSQFNDENVCTVLNSDWSCLHHFNDCENQNVGLYYGQILTSLRDKFSC